MTQLVSQPVEFEGQIHERYAVWSGRTLPSWPANEELAVVGRIVPRVDAESKVTGRAVYTDDVALPGMLFARVLRSPVANARIRRIDVSRAAVMPGVRAVICHRSIPRLILADGTLLFDRTVRFYGQAVAAVAAESEDLADDALSQISVAYDPLPFVTDPVVAARDGAPLVQACGNRPSDKNPRIYERGDVRLGETEAEVIVDLSFRTQAALHECFEPHCAVCRWEGDELTVWTSTQGVNAVVEDVARYFGLRRHQVRVIAQAIGGGFGSKQIGGEEVAIPALLARQTGRPVKLSFDRREESIATGHREATSQRIRLGARQDGTLTFIEHESLAGIGSYGFHAMSVTGPSQALYRCPNVRTREAIVYTNLAPARAFRGPGYTEGIFALECAMDELARRLNLDPLELRLRNFVDYDQVARQPYSSVQLDEAYALGAAVVGWGGAKEPPSRPTRRRGRGMASQIWGGGGGPPAYAWVELNPDGTADVVLACQDIGTGTKTALAQIAAEEIGLRLSDVRVVEGDSAAGPFDPTSAGSQIVASVGPAVRVAARDIYESLRLIAAQTLQQPAESLTIRDSTVSYGPAGAHRVSLATLLADLAPFTLVGQGDRSPNPRDTTIRTFGAHFAEVEVDLETGDVYLVRYAALHDCGRIISPLQARSQIDGGVTQGIGYALTEEQVVDPQTGIVLNPNLEDYLIPTIGDVPTVDGRFVGEIDQTSNSLGVKGLGEPPIIPVAPAIANAIADAIGVRITELPITRAKILAALQQTSGEENCRARV